MELFRIEVRPDDFDDAYTNVGRFIKKLEESGDSIEFRECYNDSREKYAHYVVRASLDIANLLRNHGDVKTVISLI